MVKVILIEDDKVLGEKGEVVEVADGYARNFLIPRKKVIIATAGNIKYYESIKKAQTKKLAKLHDEEKKLKDKIEATKLILKAKAGANKKLFGTITTEMISVALMAQLGIELDKRRIIIPVPIKMTGKFGAQLRLKYKIVANAKLEILGEEQDSEDVEEAAT